jgi:hypothetical protein
MAPSSMRTRLTRRYGKLSPMHVIPFELDLDVLLRRAVAGTGT